MRSCTCRVSLSAVRHDALGDAVVEPRFVEKNAREHSSGAFVAQEGRDPTRHERPRPMALELQKVGQLRADAAELAKRLTA